MAPLPAPPASSFVSQVLAVPAWASGTTDGYLHVAPSNYPRELSVVMSATRGLAYDWPRESTPRGLPGPRLPARTGTARTGTNGTARLGRPR